MAEGDHPAYGAGLHFVLDPATKRRVDSRITKIETERAF
jgi:hypothetical protein